MQIGPAHAQSTNEQLIEALRGRDAELERQRKLIDDLSRRVQQLEQKATQGAAASATTRQAGGAAQPAAAKPAPVVPSPPVAAAPSPAPAAPTPSVPPPATAAAPTPSAAAEGRPPPATTAQAPAPTPPRAPGQLEVDEDAAERALDRTLVTTGALLLPYGQYEATPSLSFTRRERDNIPLPQDPALETRLSRNEVVAALGLNVGLPWDSQVELFVPYSWIQQQSVLDLGTQRLTSNQRTNTLGDVTVGLAKTLLRESRYVPDVVGRVTYDSSTGKTLVNNVGTSYGFQSVRAGFTAVKRLEPLAFVGAASYEWFLTPENSVLPGNAFAFSLSALLAASPSTTMRFGFASAFQNDIAVNGTKIKDSNTVSGTFVFGISTLLGRGFLLDLAGGIGLTRDSPAFFLTASVPLRRDVPWLQK